MQRWRGLKALVIDVVEHGSRAVQRVHMDTARVPFELLARIPPLELPVKGIHAVHDVVTAGVYGTIRLVNRGVGATLDVVLDVIEERASPAGDPPRPAPPSDANPPRC